MSVIVVPQKTRAVPGCARCGRGTYDPALAPIAIPEAKAKQLTDLTEMVKVECTMEMNHQPGDPHLDKCTGWIWVHKYDRVCSDVQANAKRT